MKVEAQLLGPVAMTVDGVPLGIRSSKLLALLAALLAEPGRPVPAEQLLVSLWGESPPPSAHTTLHSYVSRLRTALRPAGTGPSVLRTPSPGQYLLVIGASSVDAVRFRAGVEAGRRELDRGRPGRARDSLTEALALWRGPALGGVGTVGRLEQFRQALEELRLEAMELRIEAELRLGSGTAAIPQLRTLVAEHPEHERFRTQLADALERSGRPSQSWEFHSAEPEPRSARRIDAASANRRPTVLGTGSDGAPAAAGPQELRISLLGPVRAWRGTVELAVGSPQQKAVLAMLAASPGRALPVADLIYGLWGSSEPPQAVAAIRTYVSRLRSALDDERPATVLTSTGDGYTLRLPDGAVDTGVFRSMRSEAARALADGDLERAVRTGAAAMALWRGTRALEGVPGFFAETMASHLAEQRIAVFEDLLAGRIALGHAADTVEELRRLAAEHPLRERAHELLMTALYRSGRTAEALTAYRRARRLLWAELGIDPGPRLNELHQQILHHDPGLLAGTASDPAAPLPRGLLRPAQLPSGVAEFIGRHAFLHELLDILRNGPSHAVPVVALTGPPGAGKTALALRAAHTVRAEFPDGQLYARLRGGSVDPSDVLRDFLAALGVDRPPSGQEQRTAMFRSLLAGRRVLIVLDDAADGNQVEPLIPGTPGSAVLITSRSWKAGSSDTRVLPVPGLTAAEAVDVLAALIGRNRVEAESAAALAVVMACAFHPLAIRLAAGFLNRHPQQSLASLLDRLDGVRSAVALTNDEGAPASSNDRGAEEDTRPTAPGRPVRSWQPYELGIHPASRKPGHGLPGYIRRAHDEALAKAVRNASLDVSGMLVLVGSAATGKSRACWEAVQPLADRGWRLWQPAEPVRPDDVLPELERLAPRTVVWLDEAQRCFPDSATGAQVARALRSLVDRTDRGPVLVLGTLWPEYAAQYTAQPPPGGSDPHAAVRSLIAGRTVHVPDTFDAAARRAAESRAEAGDFRLMTALSHSLDHGRLVQHLACETELMHRHDHASPAARAFLRAAMDGRRLGVGLLPQAFLTDASVDYLSETDWNKLDDDWAEAALAELARPVPGGSAPLRRVGPRPSSKPSSSRTALHAPLVPTGPLYRLAGLLEQHGRREYHGLCPPASFWNAACHHLTHPDDLLALGRAAESRHRLQWAHHLLLRSGSNGIGRHTGEALTTAQLARKQEASGNRTHAEGLFRQAVDAGDAGALPGLTRRRLAAGDRTEAEELYRRALDAGENHALACLVLIQDMTGSRAEAEAIALRATHSGDFAPLAELALARAEAEDGTSAELLARAVLDAGDPSGVLAAYRQRTWPDGLNPDGSVTPAWR